MKTAPILIGLVLLGVTAAILADGVIQDDSGTMIVFRDTPCASEKVLAYIHEQYHDQFKAAATRWQGKSYEACWAIPPAASDAVLVVDEGGDAVLVPLDMIEFDQKT